MPIITMLSISELRILQSLRRIIRAIEIHSQHLNHIYQITGPQLGCLLAIKQHGAMTPTRLARTDSGDRSASAGLYPQTLNRQGG